MADSKFKIGDVVFHNGRLAYGIVKGVNFANLDIQYLDDHILNDGYTYQQHWAKKYVSLKKVKNTKIARKLYPHYREDGEYLICTAKKNS